MIRHEVRCKSLPFQDGCRPRGTAPLRDDHCAGTGCTRTKFARCRVFDILFMIPFMTPPYIASMGWILFMQKKGLLQQLVPAAAGCEKIFFTRGGLVLVMSLHVFPFMLTMLKNAMLNIPSSLEEAGASVRRRIRCPDAQDLSAAALRQLCHRCAAGICENAV